MNSRWRENPIFLQFLLGCLLFLFLSIVSYLIGLISPSVSGLTLFSRANSTRTAIALTSQALMGPFPTATGPTPTPSRTPSITPTTTITPTNTPTPTPIRYFIDTSTPRTEVPRSGQTSTSAAATLAPTQVRATSTSKPPTQRPRPTSTSVQATDPPKQPTNPPPQPTNPPPQATKPPKKATKTSKPPKATKPPKKDVIMVECGYLEGCYDYLPDYALRHRENY